MKKSILFLAMFATLICLSSQLSAQNCGYRMSREHANYFASSVGYNGSGFLPMLDVADLKTKLKGDWHDYYENDVPTCSYCRDADLLRRTYSNCKALCNAYNYYNNLLRSEYNSSNLWMDMQIERMKTSSWGN